MAAAWWRIEITNKEMEEEVHVVDEKPKISKLIYKSFSCFLTYIPWMVVVISQTVIL